MLNHFTSKLHITRGFLAFPLVFGLCAAPAGATGKRAKRHPVTFSSVTSSASFRALPITSDNGRRLAISNQMALRNRDQRQVECVAKVIIHEAGNQSWAGRVAVAQVIRARMQLPNFAPDACGVVKQRGQFFNVDAYSPSRTDQRWKDAIAIATDTLNGKGEEVVPGALFFAAAGHPMRNRTKIARIDGQDFYR